jgi:hypothetical protein
MELVSHPYETVNKAVMSQFKSRVSKKRQEDNIKMNIWQIYIVSRGLHQDRAHWWALVLAILCIRDLLPELEVLSISKEAGRCGCEINDRVPFLSRPIFCSSLWRFYSNTGFIFILSFLVTDQDWTTIWRPTTMIFKITDDRWQMLWTIVPFQMSVTPDLLLIRHIQV